MAHNLPPTRLSLDPETSQALRALVEHARADLPDAATLSRFTARVGSAIVAHVPAPEIDVLQPTRVTAGVAGGKALATGVGLLVVGALAFGTFHVAHNTHEVPSVSSSGAPIVSLAAPEPTVVVASPSPSEPPQPASASSAAPQVPTARKAAAAPEPISEAALLDSARAALNSEPKRALNMTREHARRFPVGNLAQEREVIAIEALRRLGRSDAARARANSFGRQYPNSAHQSKVEQLLKDN